MRRGADPWGIGPLEKALDTELGGGSRHAPQVALAIHFSHQEILSVVGNVEQPWQAIANGSLTLKIMEAAKRLLDAARRTPTEG